MILICVKDRDITVKFVIRAPKKKIPPPLGAFFVAKQ